MVLLKDYNTQNEDEFNKHLENIFKGMDHYFENKEEKKVLFYVHGGLNTRSGSLERVVDKHWEEPSDEKEEKLLYKKIMASGYYPIFINWHSGLFSTYGDHLFNIRQGEDSPVMGAITSPIYLGIDLARSIVRAPVVWSSLLLNDLKSNPSIEKEFFDTSAIEIAKNISLPPDPNDELCEEKPSTGKKGKIHVYLGEDCRTPGEKLKYGLTYAVTLPITKLPSAPIIDSFGTSAWSNMKRRVQLLYNSDREYHTYLNDAYPPKEPSLYKPDPMPNEYHDIPISGGMSRFMQKFIQKFRKDLDQKGEDGKKKKEMQITLVGHSTGANVLNELIRNFGVTRQKDSPNDPLTLPVENIVYMAAACTISQFQSTVSPYLLQNDKTNFYNLTLGREAEIRDEYFGLTPRGSLLVWIDEFLTNPLTHRERTLGRFDNFMLTAHEIPYHVRNRVHLKTYSTGTKEEKVIETSPQHHNDFGEKIKFWDKDCWTQTSKKCYRK